MAKRNHPAARALAVLAIALAASGCAQDPVDKAGHGAERLAVKVLVYDVNLQVRFLRLYLMTQVDKQPWIGDLDFSSRDPNAAEESLIRILQRAIERETGIASPLGNLQIMHGQLIVKTTDDVHARLLSLLVRSSKSICAMLRITSRCELVPTKVVDGLGLEWRQSVDPVEGDSPLDSQPSPPHPPVAWADDVSRKPLRMTWTLVNDAQVDAFLQRVRELPDTRSLSNPRMTLFPGQQSYVGQVPMPFFQMRARVAEGNCIHLDAVVSTDEDRKTWSPGWYVSLAPSDGNRPASRLASRKYVARIGVPVPKGMTIVVRLPDPVWAPAQAAENGNELIVLIKPDSVAADPDDFGWLDSPMIRLQLVPATQPN